MNHCSLVTLQLKFNLDLRIPNRGIMGTKEQYENMAREQLLAVTGETPETLPAVLKEAEEWYKEYLKNKKEKSKTA